MTRRKRKTPPEARMAPLSAGDARPLGDGGGPIGDGGGPTGDGGGPDGDGGGGNGDGDGDGGVPLGAEFAWALGYRAWPLADGGGPLGDFNRRPGMGWFPDVPDGRDFEQPALRAAILDRRDGDAGEEMTHRMARKPSLPGNVDLRHDFGPVEDQGQLQSCSAHTVIGLVEYLHWKEKGERLNLSRLFAYKTMRNMLRWTGDRGGYIRTAVKAMVAFGAPPEEYWPYDIARFDVEPSGFLYSYASWFRGLRYARLDPPPKLAGEPIDVLGEIKRALADRSPVAFGFPVYGFVTRDPRIPVHRRDDPTPLVGGHAVIAVGYDDDAKLQTTDGTGRRIDSGERGALIIRNSWGRRWGRDGYGFLPYSYVQSRLACDFWTIFTATSFPEAAFG
jgi:C1A family cysteine protease